MFNGGYDIVLINNSLIDFPEIEGLQINILKEKYNDTNLLVLLRNVYGLTPIKKHKNKFNDLNKLGLSILKVLLRKFL